MSVAATGGTITIVNGKKIHTFTGDDSFIVTGGTILNHKPNILGYTKRE